MSESFWDRESVDYEVARYEDDQLVVNTVRTSRVFTREGEEGTTSGVEDLYLTAVSHEDYNKNPGRGIGRGRNRGEWIVAERYNSLEEAQAGHLRWISTLTAGSLPAEVMDSGNSEWAQAKDALGQGWRIKSRGGHES